MQPSECRPSRKAFRKLQSRAPHQADNWLVRGAKTTRGYGAPAGIPRDAAFSIAPRIYRCQYLQVYTCIMTMWCAPAGLMPRSLSVQRTARAGSLKAFRLDFLDSHASLSPPCLSFLFFFFCDFSLTLYRVRCISRPLQLPPTRECATTRRTYIHATRMRWWQVPVKSDINAFWREYMLAVRENCIWEKEKVNWILNIWIIECRNASMTVNCVVRISQRVIYWCSYT